jgi:pimeloyl-ACP methyl ester carboxylesterase
MSVGTSNTVTPVRSAAVRSCDGTAIAYHSLGTGPGVIVVGGAMAAGQDYLPLARVLARSFAVHVVDRRGRGGSGPQGPGYCIGKECQDLLAVQAPTGATAVFGMTAPTRLMRRHSAGETGLPIMPTVPPNP